MNKIMQMYIHNNIGQDTLVENLELSAKDKKRGSFRQDPIQSI